MEHGVSTEELEVARMLVLLPRLVWEADHGPPCTHNLRWGATKRRSAGGDDDPQQPPHPLPPAAAPPHPPPAAEKLCKKRSREAAAAAAMAAAHATTPSRKVARPKEEHSPVAAAAGTSSPETPLDFCPSAEDAARPPAKKAKPKREQLSRQVDLLNRTRTELEKEAAEIRNHLEVLKKRHSQLIDLRIKLQKEGKQQHEQESEQRPLRGRSCVDLLPTGPVRPVAAATAPDHPHPQQQHYQHAWPQQWLSNPIVFHQVAPGLAMHASPAAAAAATGNQQRWTWAAAQAWKMDGDGDGASAGKLPDLNSRADMELGVESQLSPPQQQQQQQEQRREMLEEQRAARKKRTEVMQKRRNAAACGDSVRVAGFR